MDKIGTRPLVSLIIPAYNAAGHINAMLGDIAVQTYENLEIIVIDDGSTDGTRKSIENLIVADSRMRLFTQSHTGVSSARNTGLQECRGELIGFLDADDRIEPAFVESLVSALEDAGSKISVCGWDRGTGTPTRIPAYGKDITAPALHMLEACAFFTSLWNKLFSRDVIFRGKSFEAFDETLSIGEDEEWLSRVLLRCPTCAVVPKVLYHWIERDGSATSTYLSLNSKTLTEVKTKRRVYHRFSQEHDLVTPARVRYVCCMRDLLVANYEANYRNPTANYTSLLHEYIKATEKLFGGGLTLVKSRVIAHAIKCHLPKRTVDWIASL